MDGSKDDNLVHRRTQDIPVGMPGRPGFNQTLFGWQIEIDSELKLGSCLIYPGAIAGPFPQAEMEACIDTLNLACYKAQTATTCPCFSTENISNFVNKLNSTIYNPSFVLDLDKSCKDEEMNEGLPYGLYTKKDRYEYQDIKTLQFAADVNNNKMMNRCHRYSQAPQIVPSSQQHEDCVSKLNDVCSSLKILPKEKLCNDEEDYTYKSKWWATCNRIANNHMPRWKQHRNCNRFDYKTGKYVFEHCRKSCQSCKCRTSDDPDFRFNGIEERTCTWIANLSKKVKADFCQDIDVATKCQNACGKGCCKDNTNIRFKIKRKSPDNGRNQILRLSCSDIGNREWVDLCKKKKVARFCPMKCRRCLIQPRMGG